MKLLISCRCVVLLQTIIIRLLMQIWKWMIDVGITSVLFSLFLMYFPVSAGYLNESSGWLQPMSSTIFFITRIALQAPLIGALLASWYWRVGVRGPLIYLEKLDFGFFTLNYFVEAPFTCSQFCSLMVSWLLKEYTLVLYPWLIVDIWRGIVSTW